MSRVLGLIAVALLLVCMLMPLVLVPREVQAAQTLITNWGTQRDSMDTVGTYWVGGVGASIAQDTTHYKEGTGAIAVTATAGVAGYMTRACSPTWDFSAVNNFTFWVYVPDRSKLNSIAITMASVTNMSKTHYVTIGATSYLLDGWNHIDVCKSQFSATGGEVWSDGIARLRFTATPVGGQNVTITFDDFRTDLVAGARVLLTFDDASDTQYDKAHPIMEANGQTGTLLVPVTHIGAGGDMTLGEIQHLYGEGWDVGGHGWSSLDFTTCTPGELTQEVDDAFEYMADLGFKPFGLSYPFNAYNDSVIADPISGYYAMARTVNSGLYTAHTVPNGYDEYHLRSNAVSNVTATATVEGWIDDAITRCSGLVLNFHVIVDAGADESTKYLTADFETISDYLKTKEDADLLEVVTMAEYYAELGDVPSGTTSAPTISVSEAGVVSGDFNGSIAGFGTTQMGIARFEYGPTVAYGDSTSLEFTGATGDYTASVPGDLTPGETYHCRLVVENYAGLGYGPDEEFTVPLAPLPPPVPAFPFVGAAVAYIVMMVMVNVPMLMAERLGVGLGLTWIWLANLVFVLVALLVVLVPYISG